MEEDINQTPDPNASQTGTPTHHEPPCALVIGARTQEIPPVVPGTRVLEAKIDSLTPELLARHRPTAAACPLIGPGFDAIDVARRLEALGFRGELCVLCPHLPEPDAVLAELAPHAPSLQVVLAAAGPEG